MGKEGTYNNKDAPEPTWEYLVFGVIFLLLFIFVTAFIFAKLGIEPSRESGPLPWMVK